jgi:hypothetical protein
MQPHNAIALESHSHSIRWSLSSVCELEGFRAHLHKLPKLKSAQQLAQGRAPPLFIAHKPNRAVGAFELHSAWSPDSNVRASDKGWWCPTVELKWLFQTSCWDPGSRHRGMVHHPRGGSAPDEFPPSLEKGRCHTAMVTGQSGDQNFLQINFHHFKLVYILVSFPKSPRSSKSELGAKSYAQNTKACHTALGTLQGVAVPLP